MFLCLHDRHLVYNRVWYTEGGYTFFRKQIEHFQNLYTVKFEYHAGFGKVVLRDNFSNVKRGFSVLKIVARPPIAPLFTSNISLRSRH